MERSDYKFAVLNAIGSLIEEKVTPPYTIQQIRSFVPEKEYGTYGVKSGLDSLLKEGYVKRRLVSGRTEVYYPSSSFPRELETLGIGQTKSLHPIAKKNLEKLEDKGFKFREQVFEGDSRYKYAVEGTGPNGEKVIYQAPRAESASAVVTTPHGNISVRDLLRLSPGEKPSYQTTKKAAEVYLPKSALWKDTRYLRQREYLNKLRKLHEHRAIHSVLWKATEALDESVSQGSDKYLKNPIEIDLKPVYKARDSVDVYFMSHPSKKAKLRNDWAVRDYKSYHKDISQIAKDLSKKSGADPKHLTDWIEEYADRE